MSDKKKEEQEQINIGLVIGGCLLLVLVLLYVFRESLPEMIGAPFIEMHKMIFGSDVSTSSDSLATQATPVATATQAAPAAPDAQMSTAIVPVEDASPNLKSNIGGSRFKMK